jgi:hypothetical protein
MRARIFAHGRAFRRLSAHFRALARRLRKVLRVEIVPRAAPGDGAFFLGSPALGAPRLFGGIFW